VRLRALLPDRIRYAVGLLLARRRRDRQLAARRARFEAASRHAPPRRALADLFGVGPADELRLPATSIGARDPWELPLRERCILAAIVAAAAPRNLFEFGTYLGGSTLLLAMNAPIDATVHTLELANGERRDYYRRLGLADGWDFEAGATFKASALANRVRQHFGDSATFDFSPYAAAMDLIYVDGNHGYEQVSADTRAALSMIRPGGVIVWDDYTPGAPGVVQCLNELAQRIELARIADTRFVVHRSQRV
jgi:predicted O-methyltransferase YrrM